MRNSGVVVYVKHYLTPEGIHYFQGEWFPLVYSIISQQKGFVSITYEKPSVDCVNITLKFEDDKTFDAWVSYPDHDDLINTLDAYRSRDYWEAVRAPDEQANPSTLEWIKYSKSAS